MPKLDQPLIDDESKENDKDNSEEDSSEESSSGSDSENINDDEYSRSRNRINDGKLKAWIWDLNSILKG